MEVHLAGWVFIVIALLWRAQSSARERIPLVTSDQRLGFLDKFAPWAIALLGLWIFIRIGAKPESFFAAAIFGFGSELLGVHFAHKRDRQWTAQKIDQAAHELALEAKAKGCEIEDLLLKPNNPPESND